MKSVRGIGIVLIVFAFLLASCQQSPANSLKISDSWARPALAKGNGAIYFVIENPPGQNDNLLMAESDVAEAVELHRSSMDADGNMSMQQQEKVEILAGEKVEFKPGGLHVMLINLKSDLQSGQKINATLTFEKAGKINLEIIVREP